MVKSIKRILLVDDEVEFIKSLRRHLKREGFSLEVAADGNDARLKIQNAFSDETQFDLVITDVVMPNMDGIELLQWIKKTHPEIPTILLSGFGSNEIAIETLRPEMDTYRQKPLTPREMMALIARADRNRRQHSLRTMEANGGSIEEER